MTASAPNPQPRATLQQQMRFVNAITAGRDAEVRAYLDKYPSFLEGRINHDMTPLMWASKHGNLNAMQLLLDRGADRDALSRSNFTTLMLAATNGRIECVELLLKRGANIEQKGRAGNTVLMHAANIGQTEIVELLLKRGAAIDAKSNFGMTPLMLVVRSSHENAPKIAQFLLEQGADAGARDYRDNTALRHAELMKKPEIIVLLKEWPEKKKQRDLDREIADFSSKLKRPMPAPNKLKFKKGPRP